MSQAMKRKKGGVAVLVILRRGGKKADTTVGQAGGKTREDVESEVGGPSWSYDKKKEREKRGAHLPSLKRRQKARGQGRRTKEKKRTK